MQPDEIREILEYIGQQSVSNAPFDVVVAGYVGNKTPDNAAALLRSYAEAGVTWWQEGFLPNDTLDDVRHRIHQGGHRRCRARSHHVDVEVDIHIAHCRSADGEIIATSSQDIRYSPDVISGIYLMLLCNNAMYYDCKRDYSLISSPPLRRLGAQSLVFVLFLCCDALRISGCSLVFSYLTL